MAAKTPKQRVIQAGWDGLQGDDEADGGGSADGYLAAAREALIVLYELTTAKFTPALNTGTAMDMLILTAEAMRELRAQLTALETPNEESQPRGDEDGRRGEPRGDGRDDPQAPKHPHPQNYPAKADAASEPQAQSLTPDAALLAEAAASMTSVHGPTYSMMAQLVLRLSAALRAALDRERKMKALINDDGSLTTPADYLDVLRDAMHHLHIAPQMAEHMDMLRRERDARPAELQRLKEGR